jgi:Rrf2 family iron-sulfur cluster assembly transcriptional regulator
LHLLQRVGRQIAAPATDGLRCADLVIEQGRPMRLNTKTRLAVNAMLDLALRDEAGPVVLASIAKRQQVSLSCIEQVFSLLRAAGLVRSTRGLGGGYSLGCDAASISVADIVAAIEAGSASAKAYQRRPTLADDFSQRLDAAMHVHMAAIALADLAEGAAQRRCHGRGVRKPQRGGAASGATPHRRGRTELGVRTGHHSPHCSVAHSTHGCTGATL